MTGEQKQSAGLAWHEVEAKISAEIRWLKLAVVEFVNTEGRKSDDASYRRIAVMIVQGKVRATEFTAKDQTVLWGGQDSIVAFDNKHKHGKEWHRSMMDRIDSFFTSQGYEVVTEPYLNSGRADLGVFMSGKMDLYVEVGTTSVDKLAVNLASMPACVFLLVPEGNRIIEFITQAYAPRY